MALWKDGGFALDPWRLAADDSLIGVDEPVIVSLTRWRTERDTLAGRNAPLGLLIAPGDDWESIATDLSRFAVIAVSFPKFTDGRGFSYARLLRDREHFTGEIRAVGDFYIDQVPLMRRVGIDAFHTENATVIRAFENGVWPEVAEYLQPIGIAGEVPAGTRPWARRPGPRTAD